MKKIISFIVVIVMVLCMTACDSGSVNQGDLTDQTDACVEVKIDLYSYGFENTYGMNIWAHVYGADVEGFKKERFTLSRHFDRFYDGIYQEDFIKYDEILANADNLSTQFSGGTPYRVISNSAIEYKGDYGWYTLTIDNRIVDENNEKLVIEYTVTEYHGKTSRGQAIPFEMLEVGETEDGQFYAQFKK